MQKAADFVHQVLRLKRFSDEGAAEARNAELVDVIVGLAGHEHTREMPIQSLQQLNNLRTKETRRHGDISYDQIDAFMPLK